MSERLTDEERELREASSFAARFLHAFIENNDMRQVGPLSTLCGVLTQIDKATTITAALRARVAKLEALLKEADLKMEILSDQITKFRAAIKDAPQ